MSKSTRRADLARVADLVSDLARHLRRCETTWDDLAPGVKAQSYEGPMSTGRLVQPDEDGGPRIADPTGEAAVAGTPSSRDEVELDKALTEARKLVARAHKIVKRYATEKAVEAQEIADLERQADPGCEVVGRIARDGGPNHWEPEHVSSTVGGLLPRKYRLGRWAYDFVKSNGRLPTEVETRKHLAGERVMTSA